MPGPRGLSDAFLDAFMTGLLKPVLERVKKDHTLDFQIRSEEVHIYYRGGKILGLKPVSIAMDSFRCSFDDKYFGGSAPSTVANLPAVSCSPSDIDAWIKCLPHLKEGMDFFLSCSVQKNEREFAQLIVRENNYANIANDTDYFVVDTEYVHSFFNVGQLDLIALQWKSDRHARRKGQVRLALIEVKYGDGSLTGSSGLLEHVRHMSEMARNPGALKTTEEEMLSVFAQKRKLGLVHFGQNGNLNEVKSYVPGPPEIMLVLVNHDPAKSTLISELNTLPDEDKAMLTIATSSFLGYGLHEECVYSFEDFLSRFPQQLYSGRG